MIGLTHLLVLVHVQLAIFLCRIDGYVRTFGNKTIMFRTIQYCTYSTRFALYEYSTLEYKAAFMKKRIRVVRDDEGKTDEGPLLRWSPRR